MATRKNPRSSKTGSGRVTPKGTRPPNTPATRGPDSPAAVEDSSPFAEHTADRRGHHNSTPSPSRRTGTRGGR